MAISDTHNCHGKLEIPDGDILIHAGDMSMQGSLQELRWFDAFLGRLPHRHKIVISGNHDFGFERTPTEARAAITQGIYLQDEAVEIEGLKIYGSPWQPWFCNWAFNLRRGQPLAEKWALIPDDTDILVTHGPPRRQGDLTHHGERVGCVDLMRRIREVRPRYHVFGHIHEGYGVTRDEHTTYVNACICTLDYHPTNPPIVFDVEVSPQAVRQDT